jgi:hypothetical protein
LIDGPAWGVEGSKQGEGACFEAGGGEEEEEGLKSACPRGVGYGGVYLSVVQILQRLFIFAARPGTEQLGSRSLRSRRILFSR